MTNAFHFKQFSVEQNHSGFKVGTDGCLLGAWVKVDHAKQILDIGTGSGVIALMLAQRNIDANISAIELNSESANQAEFNFKSSAYSDRIEVTNIDLEAFAKETSKRFDCIVCNPPFFSQSTPKATKSQNQARHDQSLSLDLLFEASKALIQKAGSLSIIFPSNRIDELFTKGRKHDWFPERVEYISPFPHKEPNRVLVCFSRITGVAKVNNWSLYDSQNIYSQQASDLLRPFYLKL